MTFQFTIDNQSSQIHRFQIILAGREVERKDCDASCQQICDTVTSIDYDVYNVHHFSTEKSLERWLLHDILTKISWVGILISWILISEKGKERKGPDWPGTEIPHSCCPNEVTVHEELWQLLPHHLATDIHLDKLSSRGEMSVGKISLSSNSSVPTSFVAAADW